jgi:hypothetical protein
MDKRQWGAAVAVALSLWGAIEFVRLERIWNTEFHDPYLIAGQHERFEGARQLLPPDAIVGYITDLEPNSVGWSAAYNGAQYVLAPRLLEEGVKRDWLLVNYSKAADFAAIAQQNGFRIERDFGNGVLVMRRDGR